MENVPQSPIHVTGDFFLDAELVCVIRNQAVVDCGDEVRLIQLDNCDVQAGTVGRLVVFYTVHGERWQFRPYREQDWRRVPSLDTPSSWAWRCVRTGELTNTAIGSLPAHGPTASHRPDDEGDLPFF